MIKYLRAEYLDKDNRTCYRNILIKSENKISWPKIFECVEKMYFTNKNDTLIGFVEFKDTMTWEEFNLMKEADIQKYITDGKAVDYIFNPKINILVCKNQLNSKMLLR